MANKNKHTKKKIAPAPTEMVYICYVALASGADEAGIVEHKAPLVMMSGPRPLAIRPGVCAVEANLWTEYKAHPPMVLRLASGEILGPEDTLARCSAKNVLGLLGLINTTQDAAGLQFIRDTEEARPRARPAVLEAIKKRAPKLWPMPDLTAPLLARRTPAAAKAQQSSSPAPG